MWGKNVQKESNITKRNCTTGSIVIAFFFIKSSWCSNEKGKSAEEMENCCGLAPNVLYCASISFRFPRLSSSRRIDRQANCSFNCKKNKKIYHMLKCWSKWTIKSIHYFASLRYKKKISSVLKFTIQQTGMYQSHLLSLIR